ncbi:MAG: DUF2914 domain-containing protein [Oleiphilaceae bacterium]|nr:DUF2914 domain-containing protein [Oleiphilaceae bacterium]
MAIEPVTLGSRDNSQQDNPTLVMETPRPIVVPIQSGATEVTITQPADRDLSVPVANATPALVHNRAPEQVLRATLTTGLRDVEPVDRAPALITMNAQGLKGQTLHHNWYRKGQRQARITMKPQLDRLSAHSSKYVDTHQLGDWQVIMVTDEGEVLAEAGFEVR